MSLDPRIFWLTPSTPRTNQEVAIKVYKATPDRKVEANKLDPTLRIQVSPKEGISPIILFWGWDWNPQSYSREVSGFLGQSHRNVFKTKKRNGRHQRILTKEKMWGSKNSAGAKGWKGWIFWGVGRFSDSVVRSHEVSKGSPWKITQGSLSLCLFSWWFSMDSICWIHRYFSWPFRNMFFFPILSNHLKATLTANYFVWYFDAAPKNECMGLLAMV